MVGGKRACEINVKKTDAKPGREIELYDEHLKKNRNQNTSSWFVCQQKKINGSVVSLTLDRCAWEATTAYEIPFSNYFKTASA